MEHQRALKNIAIANEKIKSINDEIESLESELRRTQKEDGSSIKYSLSIEHQINLLLKLKKANEDKVALLKETITNQKVKE